MPNLFKAAFLIFVDLGSVLLLLLILSYYGMSHIYLLLSGVLYLCLSVYDCRTGRLSEIYALMLSLPGHEGIGRLSWLPKLLSVVSISYSLPLLVEHGLFIEAQRLSMQRGLFPQFVLWSVAAAGAIMAVAVCTVIFNREKR
ncbi:MAG: hypothetical protein KGZ32_02045 [Dethiobacter sp.]|nr:hypothetical protein [Dethiobacter sp.]